MNQKKMTWKRIVAILSAIVLLATTIPIENLRAESTGTVEFKLDETDATGVILKNQGSTYTPSFTVKDAEDHIVEADAYTTKWTSSNEDVATVSETGVITAVGAGDTTVEVVCTYKDADEVEHTAKGELPVNVKVAPALKLVQGGNALESIIYPDETKIEVEGVPSGSDCTLTIMKGDEVVFEDTKTSYHGKLEAGTYKVTATTTEVGNYLEGNVTVTYVVEKGKCALEISEGKTEVYYSEKITYKVSSGSREGTFTLPKSESDSYEYEMVKSDKTSAEFEVTFNKVGTTKLEFEFTPADANYETTKVDDYSVTVKAIPVEAYWTDAQLTRVYNGEAVFSATTAPTLKLACDENFGLPELKKEEGDTYTFDLSSADKGTYTATLNETLELADGSYGYELQNSQPEVDITINAIQLTVDNDLDFSEFVAEGKNFDGTYTAKEAAVSEVKFDSENGIIEQEKASATITYTVEYAIAEDEGYELTRGDSEKDVVANCIILSDFGVLINNNNSDNYSFTGNVIHKVYGSYTISCNEDFFTFTGFKADGRDGIGGYNKQGEYHIRKNRLKKDGYTFAFDIDEEFKETIDIPQNQEGLIIYAKNSEGLISQGLSVSKVDSTLPEGYIYIQYTGVDEKDNVLSVEDFTKNYKEILNEANGEVKVYLYWSEENPLSLEYFSSNEPIDLEEWTDALWDENNQNATTKDLSGSTSKYGTYELYTVNPEVGVKNFYYARLEDTSGNVTYINSKGVLKDVIKPMITSATMDSTEKTYDKIDVYTGTTDKVNINMTVNINEGGIASDVASGVSSVEVILSKWKDGEYNEIANYNANSSKFWTDDVKEILQSIGELDNVKEPSETQVKNVSGEIELTGAFEELKDGKYKYEIKVSDKAGNEATAVNKEFIVDTKVPDIEINNVGMTNGNSNAAEDTFKDGKLVVTVSDLTLDTYFLNGYVGDIKWIETIQEDGTIVKTATFCRNAGENENELPDGVYTFTVNAEDMCEVSNEKSYLFTFDNSAPVYTAEFTDTDKNAITENNGQKLYHNDTITAEFTIEEATNYDENKINITVKNAAGAIVASWGPQAADATSAQNDLITLDHEAGSNVYTVTITKDETNHSTDDDGYTFVIKGCDATGNELVAKDATDAEFTSKVRALDTANPDLTDVFYDTASEFNKVNKTDYVNAETTVTFTLNEHNPYQSVYTLTSETSKEDTVLVWENTNTTDTYVTEKLIEQYNEKGDKQTLTLTILDKAGNKAVMSGTKRSANNTTFDVTTGTFTDSFVVDKVAPIITYEYVDENPNSVNVNAIDYFKNKAQVKVTVDEHNFDPSCAPVVVTKKNDTNVAYTETDWESKGDTHVKTFTFENDNEYVITIGATDCALNDFVLGEVDKKITVKEVEAGKTTLNLAIDKTISAVGDNKKPIVVITPVSNPGTTTDAQALYNADVVYEVSVYDPKVNNYASGIDGIEIVLTSEDGTTATATVAKDGTITTETGINCVLNEGTTSSLAKGEDNRYVYYVTISKDTFNTNGIKLSASATDVSTNVTKVTVDEIAIDTTAPVVVIDYNNDDVHNKKYFNKGRTATITVTERNFSDDCLNFYVNGKRINLEFTLKEAGTGNRDDATWVAAYKINKDGDYVIKCNAKDRVGNTATVKYKGKATNAFTIDKTKPIITLTFNNNNAQNGSYYSSARTATITINEHNFRGSDIEITGTANNAGAAVSFPGISRWTSKGDIHTATITFTEDALYSLDVAYKDLALNKAKSPANNTFTIDNTDPVINFSDVVQGGAYPDEVVPKISFNDNNYLSHTVTLTRTNMDNKNEDVTSKFVKASGVNVDGTGKATGSNTIPDIAHEEENDGIYTITVTVNDKAGRSKTQSITYSINRFGSVYVYSDDLLDLMNGYTKLEDIADKDLYIEAYNANTLVEDSTKLEITCDGSSLANQLSTANVATDKLDSNGWNVYRFKLNNEDFANEGSYVITISDKDSAGNVQTNSDNPIEFSVDGTDPKLDSVIGLEEERYNVAEQVVKYVVSDAMGIAKVEIYIDGELVDTIEEFDNAASYEGQFIIPESSNRQNVKIIVTDKSGRVLDTSSKAFVNDSERGYVFNSSVMVSTSLFDLWYDNKPLFWGSIAGVAVLLGLFFFIIIGKKKKEEEEEDEVA